MKRTVYALILGAFLAPIASAQPPGLEPRGPRGEGPPPMHLLEEVRDREPEILAWVEQFDRDGYRKLLELKARDTRLYLGQLVRIARIIQRADADPSVVERHREMRSLEQKVDRMVAQWDDLDPEARKSHRALLDELVGQLFELRQEERRSQLAELEEKIKELKGEINQREKDRKAIIDDYVDQLIREPVDL